MLSDQLASYEKEYFTRILNKTASEVELSAALEKLSKMLTKYYGTAPIIIIDEYDTPIQEGYSKDFYEEIVGEISFPAHLKIIRIFLMDSLLEFYGLLKKVFSAALITWL